MVGAKLENLKDNLKHFLISLFVENDIEGTIVFKSHQVLGHYALSIVYLRLLPLLTATFTHKCGRTGEKSEDSIAYKGWHNLTDHIR